MNPSQPAICILYGFAEGPAISKQLCAKLQAAGYALTNQAEQADIIIAHSGGLLALPPNLANKLVLLIAPSHNRRYRSLFITELDKVFRDLTHHLRTHQIRIWTHRFIWSIVYLLSHPIQGFRMWLSHRQRDQPLPSLNARKVIIVSYRNDPWSSRLRPEDTYIHPNYRYITLDSIHDDLWLNPNTYIQIIRSDI